MDAPQQQTPARKVTIVEDDGFIGSILYKHMIDNGINVTLLTTGDGAADIVKADVPDILILDILLPGVNGVDVLTDLRRDPRTATLPVLVISNTDDSQNRESVKLLGGHFLIKAMVTPLKIVEYMEEVLSGKKQA